MSTIVCQNNLASHFESQHTTTTLKLKVAENINRDFESSSSFSSMSAESLDLCTENLGSESGSDVTSGDVNIFSNPSSPRRSKSAKESVFEKKTKNYLYPPPLTTIKNLQMRRHREEGRLIVEAVEMNSYLQAERSDGRLRLCFFNGVEQEEEDDDGDDDDDYDDDIEEESEKEMEMEKYHQRLSSCHNTRGINEGLCCSNWKPALWVASS